MTQCTRCKEVKPDDDFAFRRRRGRVERQGYCRACQAEYYALNKVRIRKQIKDRKRVVRDENRAYVRAYLLEHPCIDCGEDDPIVLDFDHVRGAKIACISEMSGYSWNLRTIITEIEKCEVRCANCHRRVTARRRQGSVR